MSWVANGILAQSTERKCYPPCFMQSEAGVAKKVSTQPRPKGARWLKLLITYGVIDAGSNSYKHRCGVEKDLDMYERIVTWLILVVAVIHLLPLAGFFGVDRLASLYGVEIRDNNLEILMRHRAVVFGILGAFFAYAAFAPAIQPVAFLAAFVSIASFLYLSFSVGEFNDSIRHVVIADIVAAVSILGAVVSYALKRIG